MTTYQEGLEDGFIDALVQIPMTREEYLRVTVKYEAAFFHPETEYQLGYRNGIDSGVDYLKAGDKQYQHNWTDISTWDSGYKTELCTGPACICGGSTRRKLRYSNDEWEYSK